MEELELGSNKIELIENLEGFNSLITLVLAKN